MKAIIFIVLSFLFCTGCSKTTGVLVDKATASSDPAHFIRYTIQRGNQYCDGNSFREVDVQEMKFIAKFDSSAIYQTALPENQYDINKLYGFSDNGADHHQYSARLGWRWSNNSLRLFAYVYNNGSVTSRELAVIAIGTEVACSIKVTSTNYLFTINGMTTQLPRMATTGKGKGYQLYPYFGGDEPAPHQINIWIRNVE